MTWEREMKQALLICMLLLSGCNLQSPDYYKIMLSCAQQKGYYFTVTVPTWLSPRLVAGCAEDMRGLEVTVIQIINGDGE